MEHTLSRWSTEEQWTTGGREGLGSVLLSMKPCEVYQFSMMMTWLWEGHGIWGLRDLIFKVTSIVLFSEPMEKELRSSQAIFFLSEGDAESQSL